MQISAILVHVDADCAEDARLAYAVMAATRFHATLIGLLTETVDRASARSGFPARRLAQCLPTPSSDALDAARCAFDEATATASLPVDWRVGDRPLVEAVQYEGRFADLVVLGQPRIGQDLNFQVTAWDVDLMASAIFGTGRPVLQVPRTHAVPSIGKRVLISWRGSRACGRALQDALPWLERAGRVHILCTKVQQVGQRLDAAPVSSALKWLDHHDIHASLSELPASTRRDMGTMLLSRVYRWNVDLIVCGVEAGRQAAGRWDDTLFGALLIHAPTAVLFSH